jgi:hypothetical protein
MGMGNARYNIEFHMKNLSDDDIDDLICALQEAADKVHRHGQPDWQLILQAFAVIIQQNKTLKDTINMDFTALNKTYSDASTFIQTLLDKNAALVAAAGNEPAEAAELATLQTQGTAIQAQMDAAQAAIATVPNPSATVGTATKP